MRYELYLRAIEPGAGSAKALMAALEQEPTTRRQQLQFSVDESDVRGALYPADPAFWEAPQDGVSFGLDLEIPGEASEQVSAALCEVAFRWAEQWALSVYDPQLGRTVTKRDREVICARIKRQADYLAERLGKSVNAEHPAFAETEKEVRERLVRLFSVNGSRSPDSFHRELGAICWEFCGMSRNRAGLEEAICKLRELEEQYWKDVRVLGSGSELNQSLELAGRVADYFELAELMCRDALHRDESCGGHFREEYQTPEGEALPGNPQ